jgi:hypothetical protein
VSEEDNVIRSACDKVDEASEPLLASIKQRLPELEELLKRVSDHWGFEDGFYRFYHQSFKVYGLQVQTVQIREALAALNPGKEMNAWFCRILDEGTCREFVPEANQDWLAHTRPILEAFFHARTMLELAVKYGRELERAPTMMPSGWAALLYLYNMRWERLDPPLGVSDFVQPARADHAPQENTPFEM